MLMQNQRTILLRLPALSPPSPSLSNLHRTKGNVIRKKHLPNAMLSSSFRSRSVGDDADDNNNNGGSSSRNFKLNESTFLASLMPKTEIGVDRFLHSYPHYDGRGVLIAIFEFLSCSKVCEVFRAHWGVTITRPQ